MDKDFKKQEKRIESIFPKDFDDIYKRDETQEIYIAYLKSNLTFPITLTGIKYFGWEILYFIGLGDYDEFKKLRKTRPSSTDTFIMIRIDDDYHDDYGLFAKLTRVSDKKRFKFPLADLKAVDEKTKNYQILDDYAVWVENY